MRGENMSSSDRLYSSPTGGWPTPSVHIRTGCELTYLATGKITKRIEEVGSRKRTRIEDLYITESSPDGVSGKKVRLLTHYDVDGNMNGKAQALFVVKEKTADSIAGRYTTTSVLLLPSEYNLLKRRLSGRHGCRRATKIRVSLGDNLGHAYVYMGELSGLVTVTIKGLEYGADAYIEKPFSVSHLQAQLANLIVGRSKLRKLFSTTPQTSTRIEAFNRLDQEFADRCTSIITESVSDPDFSVDVLAREMGMSRTSIFVKLKAITGMTPNEFIKLIRLKVACRMMAEGSYRATEVGFLVGFNSSSYFAKCFFRQFGIRPNDYIKTLEQSRENTSGKTGPDSDNN